MIKEYITTPQSLALAAMMFTWGLTISINSKTLLSAIKVLWIFLHGSTVGINVNFWEDEYDGGYYILHETELWLSAL